MNVNYWLEFSAGVDRPFMIFKISLSCMNSFYLKNFVFDIHLPPSLPVIHSNFSILHKRLWLWPVSFRMDINESGRWWDHAASSQTGNKSALLSRPGDKKTASERCGLKETIRLLQKQSLWELKVILRPDLIFGSRESKWVAPTECIW